ncbi:hypothetical protein [Streptomyces sp. CB00455]|uniref:hypothetical protein n=1 Tax=Streptomyces sp. CB00455 TaxID=1703927 RepID=UPI0018FE1EFF|nr:hypothetical protein [Streptomyces sp. CB00455]
MSLALLLTTAAATAVGAAALHAVHGLRKQVTALRGELAAPAHPRGAAVPHARSAVASPAAEIRAAVAEALAEERERELAEARAFWAAQEARDAADASPRFAGETPGSLLGGLPGLGEESPLFLPRQADLVGLEAVLGEDVLDEYPEDSAELAAARRRHPSHPDFVPVQAPHPGADHERTVSRLEELAEARTALADVRPGPLGTLDVYVFTDGTTLCMTPGHRETAERLAEALRAGTAPVLLGGSGISGAYALTFSCGDTEDPDSNVYILADRVIASL